MRKQSFGIALISFVVVSILGCFLFFGGKRGFTSFRSVPPKIVRWPVMGTIAQVQYCNHFEEIDEHTKVIKTTYQRLEQLLSAWNPHSELSQLSRKGGTNWFNHVSNEVRPCYDQALRLSHQSNGSFNPWMGRVLRQMGVSRKGVYSDFDLGGIAKGFAVDCVYANLLKKGEQPVPHMLLDLGGNLRVVGEKKWETGIRNPFVRKVKSLPHMEGVCATITLTNGESIATSGNYERFIEKDGVRYSHILDGRTGKPTSGIASVTVVTSPCDGAILADGLSTTLFILGPHEGAAFLQKFYPKAMALWIPDSPHAPHLIATSNLVIRLEKVAFPCSTVSFHK